MSSSKLVSIITPSLNQGRYIERTIESVRQQTYPHIEYIIVDGGSTDNTPDILQQYDVKWSSYPGIGQSEAVNIGMAQAEGDILAWLNGDDLYFPYTVQTVVDYFHSHEDAHFIYGDVVAIDAGDRPYGKRPFIQQTNFDELLNVRNRIVQPGAFWRLDVWETCGALDETLDYVMDYEYWMRVTQQYQARYMPVSLAQERLHADAKTFDRNIERIQEVEQIALRHGANGIPSNFHSEAAATYVLSALAAFTQGKQQTANEYLQAAQRLDVSPLKFTRHLVALASGKYAPLLWLMYTRALNIAQRKRHDFSHD